MPPGIWDWDEVTTQEAPRFLEETHAAYVDAYHLHWRRSRSGSQDLIQALDHPRDFLR